MIAYTAAGSENTNRLALARMEAKRFYGADLNLTDAPKALKKFGSRANLGTSLLEVTGLDANEVFVSSNLIDSVVSTSGSDTNTVVIEGHTISGSDLTFVVQTVTLTGQTRAALTTPLARATRLYNSSATDHVGQISVYQNSAASGGVVTDQNKVHIKTLVGGAQSVKCATSISSSQYYLITEVTSAVLKAQSRSVNFFLDVRQSGGVWRPAFEWGSASTGSTTTNIALDPVVIVKPNSDVRIAAISSGTATDVAATFGGHLAEVL